MIVVCKDRIENRVDERLGVGAAAAVEADVTALLSGKSYEHLVTLQRQIQSKLASGEPVDTDYWEGLLKKLLVWKAKVSYWLHCQFCCVLMILKAKLKVVHEVVVRNRLEQLRKRQRDEALQAQEELLAGVANSASKKSDDMVVPETDYDDKEPEEEREPYDRSMSLGLLDITKLPAEERQIDILTEEEDYRALVSVYPLSLSGMILTFPVKPVRAASFRGCIALCAKGSSADCRSTRP